MLGGGRRGVVSARAYAAVFDWQEGPRRLAALSPDRQAACLRVVDAIQVELRRRLGRDFTVDELAEVYTGAGDWALPIAVDVAPRVPEAHDGAITTDAAFARFVRNAKDVALI